MTPADIAIVRRQFAATRGMEQEFAAAFYARLFQIAPQVRPLFPPDLGDQSKKLMTTLALAVNALDRGDALRPVVLALGERHVAYGATPEMLGVVGEALLDTLAAALGDGFDLDARAAWLSAYAALAGMMAEGMRAAAARAA